MHVFIAEKHTGFVQVVVLMARVVQAYVNLCTQVGEAGALWEPLQVINATDAMRQTAPSFQFLLSRERLSLSYLGR